jgi:hypothetical protein
MNDLINQILSSINPFTIVRNVWRFAQGLWSFLVVILTGTLAAFAWTWASANNMANGAIHAAVHLPSFLLWLLTVRIPQWAASTLGRAIDYAQRGIADLYSLARGWVNEALSFAQRIVNDLWHDYLAFVNWVRQQLINLFNVLDWTYHTVLNLLTNPDVLAQWLLSALGRAAYNWALSHAEYLFRLFLATAVRGTVIAGDLVDEVISRVL